VVVDSDDEIAGCAILVGPVLPHPGSGIGFQFLQSFCNCLLVGLDQAALAGELGHDGNGFGSGDGEVVEIAAVALSGAIGSDAIGALALAEEFPGVGIDALPDGFELLRIHVTGEAEQLRAPALPLADNALAFGVIVAVLQVPGRIALPVGHGADRQHC